MVISIRSVFYLLLLTHFFPFLSQSITVTKTVTKSELAELLPKEAFLEHVSCASDTLLSHKEFHDITDLHSGMSLTPNLLHKAIKNLFKKNKFKEISIFRTDLKDGIELRFDITGLWTFQTLKVSGVWVGKDWYKQYYLMEPGDSFDLEKHNHSMKKIRDVCARDGFFNVHTKSSLTRDHKTKSIKVHTELSKDTRFRIKEISLQLHADGSITKEMIATLEKQIYKKYLRNLHNAKYAKTVLEEQAKSIKQFLAHAGFLDVSIELIESIYKKEKKISLHWHINVHKKRTFVFFGNRFFSNYQLLDRLFQFGRSAWILPASMLSQEIKRAYHAKGFWDFSIDTREEGARSFFVIKEGKRSTISQISIQSASAIPESLLIKRCFSKFKRRNNFDQELLQNALELVMSYYLKEGFLDFKIVGHEFIPLEGEQAYRLVVMVEEGLQTRIDIVSIPDFPELERMGPFLAINKKKKSFPYNALLIQRQKKWLQDYCNKKGFLYASITSKIESENDQSKLIWSIDTGQTVRFGKTIINGSSSFAYDYIKRELEYNEGDLWDHEKIRRSFLRLKNLELFDSVSFIPLPREPEAGRNILVKLHEDDPFELRIRTGLELQHIQQYQTYGGLTYKVGGTFMVKNPTNHFDLFRFDVDVARSHREATLKYYYPWLFNFPIDGLMQGYSIKYEQPGFIGSKKNLYTIFQNGVLFGLRHKTVYSDFGVNVGFEVARTTISKDDAATRELARELSCAMNFDPTLLNKRIPFVFLEPTFIVDLLDNNLDPTRGIFSLLSLKGMFPTNNTFSNSYFVKLLVEHACFASFGPTVAAFRFRFGHIFHRKFCEIMPNERFYLGGAHSIRSYEADHAPPLGCFINVDGKKCIVPRGGKTMLNINAELRVPLFERVRFVLFQDIGLLSGDNFVDFTPNNIVAGTGFGLRFLTPIGPLRFDIAWKWKKQLPDERAYNWFLTFGQAF